MQRIGVLLVVLVLLAELNGGAMAARWEKTVVPVWDFMPPEYRESLQRVVNDFNANMPESAPTLRYIPLSQLMCEDLNPRRVRGGIAVCVSRLVPNPTPMWQPRVIDEHGVFVRGQIAMRDYRPLKTDNLFCHELMHAVVDAPDLEGSMRDSPLLDDSCVQGLLEHLGPWDISYAAQVYNDNGRRSSEDRRHHRKRH